MRAVLLFDMAWTSPKTKNFESSLVAILRQKLPEPRAVSDESLKGPELWKLTPLSIVDFVRCIKQILVLKAEWGTLNFQPA